MPTRPPIARPTCRALAAALLASASLLAGPALAAEPAPIALLGLRPTEDAAFGATAIAQLAEAQRLRQVVENVIEVASASKVLGHEPLRASLGRAYLVELFDCRGEATCLIAAARPLRAAGVTTAVVGDYFAAEGALKVRLRKLDLVREQVAEELVFEVPRDDAGALAPWRAGLAPLFGETGTLKLVVSQPEAQCLLDGRPCSLDGEGIIAEVPEGEHLLVVTKDGFKRSERVVAVRRREQARVAVALEELPVQAQKTPDPANRVPTFAQPTDAAQARPFGSLRLAIDYYIDSLTLVMFTMVTLIASLIHLFAIGYMSDELTDDHEDHQVHTSHGHLHRPGRFHRFFAFMSLFSFSMLGLVLAGNIFMVFIFWELVGVCSYFLIGFYTERKSASKFTAPALPDRSTVRIAIPCNIFFSNKTSKSSSRCRTFTW